MTEETEKAAVNNLMTSIAQGGHLASFSESLIVAAVMGVTSQGVHLRAEEIAKKAIAIKEAVLERLARNALGVL